VRIAAARGAGRAGADQEAQLVVDLLVAVGDELLRTIVRRALETDAAEAERSLGRRPTYSQPPGRGLRRLS
jgi:hypothetical protein